MATKLRMNSKTIDRLEEIKLVGVWVTTWLDWDKNTIKISKNVYDRMSNIN